MAISGQRFAVGSPFANRDGNESAGAAAVLQRTAEGLALVSDLVPSNVGPFYYLGEAVAIFGERVAVTAAQDETFAQDAGAVYIFEPGSTGAYEEIQVLSGGEAGSQFGLGLAMTEKYVVAGAPFGDPPGADNGGSSFHSNYQRICMQACRT